MVTKTQKGILLTLSCCKMLNASELFELSMMHNCRNCFAQEICDFLTTKACREIITRVWKKERL